MPPSATLADVFVSYASKDQNEVVPLVRALEQAGVTVWRDGDQILGGQLYAQQIAHAIAHSKVVLLMCSPNAFASDNVHREVFITWDYHHRTYVPVWLGRPGPIPDRFQYPLAGCHWVTAHAQPTGQVVEQLLTALESFGVSSSRRGTPTPASPAAPARTGLRFEAGSRPLPGVDWELVELLGKGGFGEVWKARNPTLPGQRPVALKFCLDLDGRACELLRHEAEMVLRAQESVGEAGIVPLRHAYLNNDPPCLEYPYYEGGTLVRLIEESRAATNPLTPTQAMRMIQRVARTVGTFHRGSPPLVHCDLKPANILARREGGKVFIRVTDFGIGRAIARADLDKSRTSRSLDGVMASVLTGAHTPLYASPQQVRGDAPKPTDDVYALGVIWYHLLTADLTSPAPTGRKWAEPLRQRGMPEPAVELLVSCFETEPSYRPADGIVLADWIQHALPKVDASWSVELVPPGPDDPDALPGRGVFPPPARATDSIPVLLPAPVAPPASVPSARREVPQPDPIPYLPLAPVAPTSRRAPETRPAAGSRTALAVAKTVRPTAGTARRRPRRRRWSWLWVLFTCLVMIGGAGGAIYYLVAWHKGRRSVENLTQRVDDLFEANDDEQALQLCNEAVRWSPDSPLAWCERGRVRIERKEYDEAIKDLDEAIRLDPRYALAFARRGSAYAGKKDLERAFKDCDRAIEIDPQHARAYINRAIVLKGKGMLAQAIHDLDEAIRLEPKESTYNERGRFYTALDADRAIKDFTESINIKPNANAYANRAFQYLVKGEQDPTYVDKGIADCTEALRLKSQHAYAFEVRGRCYAEKKDYDRAESDLSEAIRFDRRNAEAYFRRAFVYRERKKNDLAIRDYKAAIDLDYSPKWYAINNLAGAYLAVAEEALDRGDFTAARDANDKSLKLRDDFVAAKPWHLLVTLGRGENYRFNGRRSEKEGALTRAAEAHQQASDHGSPAASKRLAEMVESGSGVVKNAAKAAALRKKAEGQSLKRFTVPCLMGDYDKKVPLPVYLTTPLDDKEEDPLAGEARRLKEDHNATVPPEVVDSFKRLLKIARENHVSFPDLCVYALGTVQLSSEVVGQFTQQLQTAWGQFLTLPATGTFDSTARTIAWQATAKKRVVEPDLFKLLTHSVDCYDAKGKLLGNFKLDAKQVTFTPSLRTTIAGGTIKVVIKLPPEISVGEVARVRVN